MSSFLHLGSMKVQTSIEDKLMTALSPEYLLVINESHQHNVPQGSESHFKVVVSTKEFEGMRLLGRHRMINKTLADELAGEVHALALHTYTPDEWKDVAGQFPDSPRCMGGSKKG